MPRSPRYRRSRCSGPCSTTRTSGGESRRLEEVRPAVRPGNVRPYAQPGLEQQPCLMGVGNLDTFDLNSDVLHGWHDLDTESATIALASRLI